MVTSSRISTRVLFSGDDKGEPIIFIHGNASSAACWEEAMLSLPAHFRGIAPDMRGFGESDASKLVEGIKSWEDDVIALADHFGIERFHLVAHSANGVTAFHLLMDHPDRLLSVTLAATVSPFGSATGTVDGKLIFPDGAGGGAASLNAQYISMVASRNEATRHIMNTLLFHPPFRAAREDEFLEDIFRMRIGATDYPGDKIPSPHWPFFGPGKYGLTNAIAGKNARDLAQLYRTDARKPRILWIRGAHDAAVQDCAPLDLAVGAANGYFPDYPPYPGNEVFPPQPSLSQIRFVLQKYRESGGSAEEVALECGHFPFVEKVKEFSELLGKFVSAPQEQK